MSVTDIHTGPARRYVITGGPSAGKEGVLEAIHKVRLPCSTEEAAREIYRRHRARLGRHLQREDRRAYSREVLEAFIAEYKAHTEGVRFYNRGIPDGYGWDRFFGLDPYPELEDANRLYRYDGARPRPAGHVRGRTRHGVGQGARDSPRARADRADR
jgi:predicted ATPase